LLFYYPVQPYPFTFISAVKQKLALEDYTDIGIKTHDLNSQTKNSLTSSILKATSSQNSSIQNQSVQKMDFIKPLKVPDLKISPKTLDFSSKENSKELSSTKSEIVSKEFVYDRSNLTIKGSRTGERVQRKLDFSSLDGSSFINCESIEPLKAPNVSIASNLSKKEHVRDNSREKENRSKRMKKDDSFFAKRDESMQDQIKCSRSPRYISRKDASDMSNTKLSKNDRLFHVTKINDFSVKSKDKNFVTSITKKDNDKRQRSLNTQSVELINDSLPKSKIRISDNESSVFPSLKVLDKVTSRDNNIGVLSSTENKSKDISHYFLKQKSEIEDLKHKSDLDNRLLKQEKLNTIYKEQTKRVSDKNKMLNNKSEDKHSVNLEPSEDIEFLSETNSSRSYISAYPMSSIQSSKSKDLETAMESKENINSVRSTKTSENFKYTELSVIHSANASVKKDEESCSQNITTKETTTNDDSNVDDSILPEALFDPRRISLRDGYSQPEFHNLMTPEKMNLMLGPKRRKYLMQSSDSEVDARCPRYKPTIIKSEKEQEEVQLVSINCHNVYSINVYNVSINVRTFLIR